MSNMEAENIMRKASRLVTTWSPWWLRFLSNVTFDYSDKYERITGFSSMLFTVGTKFLSHSSIMDVAIALEYALQQASRRMDIRFHEMKSSHPGVPEQLVSLASALEINSDMEDKFSKITDISWSRIIRRELDDSFISSYDAEEPPKLPEGSWTYRKFDFPPELRAETYLDLLIKLDEELEKEWLNEQDKIDSEQESDEPEESDTDNDGEESSGENSGKEYADGSENSGSDKQEDNSSDGEDESSDEESEGKSEHNSSRDSVEPSKSVDNQESDGSSGDENNGQEGQDGSDNKESGNEQGGESSHGSGDSQELDGGESSGSGNDSQGEGGDCDLQESNSGDSPGDSESGREEPGESGESGETSPGEFGESQGDGSSSDSDNRENTSRGGNSSTERYQPLHEKVSNESDEVGSHEMSSMIRPDVENVELADEIEREKLSQELAEDIKEFLEDNNMGSSAGGMGISKDFIEWSKRKLHKPRSSWKRVLPKVLNKTMGRSMMAGVSDMTYGKRNPNQQEGMPMMMGFVTYPPTAAILIDASPSMHHAKEKVMSEFMGMISHFFMKYGEPISIVVADNKIQYSTRVVSISKKILGRVSRTYMGGSNGLGEDGFGNTMEKMMRGKAKFKGSAIPKADILIVFTDGGFDWPYPDNAQLPRSCGKVIVVCTRTIDDLKKDRSINLPGWVRDKINFVSI